MALLKVTQRTSLVSLAWRPSLDSDHLLFLQETCQDASGIRGRELGTWPWGSASRAGWQ
jgi:hypothetical protein